MKTHVAQRAYHIISQLIPIEKSRDREKNSEDSAQEKGHIDGEYVNYTQRSEPGRNQFIVQLFVNNSKTQQSTNAIFLPITPILNSAPPD